MIWSILKYICDCQTIITVKKLYFCVDIVEINVQKYIVKFLSEIIPNLLRLEAVLNS